MEKFFFVTLEGIDGSGKTTQAKLVSEKLIDKGFNVVTFREPGTTEAGARIRELLFDKSLQLSSYAELFLFLTARAELITKVLNNIEPGTIVIGDRFWDSTIAYQHYGKGLSIEMINVIKSEEPFNVIPDMTIWLDIPVELSVAREEDNSNINDHINIINRVREGFQRLYQDNQERIIRIDGEQGRDAVTEQIVGLIENRYIHSGIA